MNGQACRTVEDVIKAIGGRKAVMALTRRSTQCITNWKGRQQFPAYTYVLLNAELMKQNCVAPSALWGMPDTAPQNGTRNSNRQATRSYRRRRVNGAKR